MNKNKMPYSVTINASTGVFSADFDSIQSIVEMAAMVAAGAQVRQSWGISIKLRHSGAGLHIDGTSTSSMVQVIEEALHAAHYLRRPERDLQRSYDVVVPVNMAVAGDTTLTDAEDFVRRAMERALIEHSKDIVEPKMQFNGDPVTQGHAYEDN